MFFKSENTLSHEAELGDIANIMRAALRHSLRDIFEMPLQKAEGEYLRRELSYIIMIDFISHTSYSTHTAHTQPTYIHRTY